MDMRIGIDIDDTIMDTFDYMVPFVAEYFGLDPDEMKKKRYLVFYLARRVEGT